MLNTARTDTFFLERFFLFFLAVAIPRESFLNSVYQSLSHSTNPTKFPQHSTPQQAPRNREKELVRTAKKNVASEKGRKY